MEKIGTAVIFESATLRIWSLILRPQEATSFHVHDHPYTYVVVTPGQTVMELRDGQRFAQNDERWACHHQDERVPHRLVNLSNSVYENIIIEELATSQP